MNNSLAEVHYSNRKGLKAELGSDRLLGVPLETYIPSEKLAIESGSADENIEIMKAYMCKQRGITGNNPTVSANLDCQHFFRQIFLGYFPDIVQAFGTLGRNVYGDDYTSLHNPIVLSSVLLR